MAELTRARFLGFVVATFGIAEMSEPASAAVKIEEPTGFTFGPMVKDLALGVKLENQAVDVGAPIACTLAIKNFGPPRHIFRIGAMEEYALTGTGPRGTSINQGGPGDPSILDASADGPYVETGQAYEKSTADLRKGYDFSAPGEYAFSFATVITQGLGGPWYAVLTSNTVTLDVRNAATQP
jgi:hypothetical protein